MRLYQTHNYIDTSWIEPTIVSNSTNTIFALACLYYLLGENVLGRSQITLLLFWTSLYCANYFLRECLLFQISGEKLFGGLLEKESIKTEGSLEPCRKSKMEFVVKIVNSLHLIFEPVLNTSPENSNEFLERHKVKFTLVQSIIA